MSVEYEIGKLQKAARREGYAQAALQVEQLLYADEDALARWVLQARNAAENGEDARQRRRDRSTASVEQQGGGV
jgi:type IV secretory pathway VirD2 relaxase